MRAKHATLGAVHPLILDAPVHLISNSGTPLRCYLLSFSAALQGGVTDAAGRMRGVTNRISERRAKREAHSSPGEKALSHCSQSSSKSPQLHLLLLWPSASYTEESEDLGLLSGLVLCQQHIKTMHAVGGINTRCIGRRAFFAPVASAKGFGKTQQKKKKATKPKFREGDDSWVRVGDVSDFQGKQIKAVELKDKSVVALYNVDDEVYCSDANSTAYKFPLTNANIIERNGGPAVEVALDGLWNAVDHNFFGAPTNEYQAQGTVYDLRTGKVLDWCPKNNILRSLLGTLKSNQDPENLKVYPAEVDDGKIYVQFA